MPIVIELYERTLIPLCLRGGSLFIPRGRCLMLREADAYSIFGVNPYFPRSARRMLTMLKTDAYYSCPHRGYLYFVSHILQGEPTWSSVTFIMLCEVDQYEPHLFLERDLHLLCFARQILIITFHEMDLSRFETSPHFQGPWGWCWFTKPEAYSCFIWSARRMLALYASRNGPLFILWSGYWFIMSRCGRFFLMSVQWTLIF